MRKDAVANRGLLTQTAAAMFREQGADVSLEAIASEAGVGIGTMYRHFPNRGELLLAVLHMYLDCYADFVEKHVGGAAMIPDFLRFIGPGMVIYSRFAEFIQHETERTPAYLKVFERFDAILSEVADRTRREGIVAEWVDATALRVAGRMLIGLHDHVGRGAHDADLDIALNVIQLGVIGRNP